MSLKEEEGKKLQKGEISKGDPLDRKISTCRVSNHLSQNRILKTGEKSAKSFLFQSLSMNLQRGNALCVMGTVAHHRKLEEIYNLGTISTQEEQFKTYLLYHFFLLFNNILSDCQCSDVIINSLLNAFRLKKIYSRPRVTEQ